MEKKYISNEYTKVHTNAKAAFISDDIQQVLNEYIETEDENLLYKIIDEKPAHTIDVIYKESVRTYEIDKESTRGVMYYTEYEKFDKDKVFFNVVIDGIKNDLRDDPWHYPITVYTDRDNVRSNFISHNYFYEPDILDILIDDNNLLINFYQDIDILCSEDYFKQDLITALYRVVVAAYWYWQEEIEIIEETNEWMNEIEPRGFK